MVGDDRLSFLRKRADQLLWQVSWLVSRVRAFPFGEQWREDRTRVGRLTVAGTASGLNGIPY